MTQGPDNAKTSSGGGKPVAEVYPSKKSYQSIASDVTTQSALSELIDNAIDSARLHDINPVRVEIEYHEEEEELVVRDYSGGVKQDEMGVFLGLGRSKEQRVDDQSIGAFGLGTKKALNHLSNDFTIASQHQDANTGWKYTVTAEWFENDDLEEWEFEMEPVELGQGVTELRLRELTFDWKEEFDDIREGLIETYQKYLDETSDVNTNLHLELNNETLTAPDPVDWTFSPWQNGTHPRQFVGLTFTHEEWPEPITARITVGLTRQGDLSNHPPGTYIFCQNRLVEKALQDRTGGFGVEGMNKFTPARDKQIRIEIELLTDGPANILPWNSDKSRIDRMHEVFMGEDGIYYWLKRFADRHKSLGQYGSGLPLEATIPYDADSEYAANGGKIEVIDVSRKQRRKKQDKIDHPRIHDKPSKDLSDIQAMQRAAKAHALLGIRCESIEWFEEWMLPTYRALLADELTENFNPEQLGLLLDLENTDELYDDSENIDEEALLAALPTVEEAPDGREDPWGNYDDIEDTVANIDSQAQADVEEKEREPVANLPVWSRQRYDYALKRAAADRGVSFDDLTPDESDDNEEVDLVNETVNSDESDETENNEDSVQENSVSDQDTDTSDEVSPSPDDQSDASTQTDNASDSETTTKQESITGQEVHSQNKVSTPSTQPTKSGSDTAKQEDSSPLEEFVEQNQEAFKELGVKGETPEERLLNILEMASKYREYESHLENAEVEGDSPEERLKTAIDKAQRYEKMMAAAQED